MKSLDLNAMGVVEMNTIELKTVDGGIWEYLLGYIIGKAIDAIPEALEAAQEIKAEGGTLVADMPFK